MFCGLCTDCNLTLVGRWNASTKQTWQHGERVSRSHFLSRSLERARLIASATQPPKPRPTSLLPASISLPPLPYGQTTLPEVLAHRQTSLLPLAAAPRPVPRRVGPHKAVIKDY